MATRQRHVRAQAERRRFATTVVMRRAATAPAVGAACDDVEGVPQQRCRTSHQSKVPAKLMFRVGVASAAAPGAVNERLFCTPIAGFWSIEDLRFRPPTLFPNRGKTRQKNVFRFFQEIPYARRAKPTRDQSASQSSAQSADTLVSSPECSIGSDSGAKGRSLRHGRFFGGTPPATITRRCAATPGVPSDGG